MATNKKSTKTATAKSAAKGTGKIITVKELAETLATEPRKLRQFIRSLGMKAPETGVEGFGPKAKYEWEEGSKELDNIIEKWEEAQEAAEASAK